MEVGVSRLFFMKLNGYLYCTLDKNPMSDYNLSVRCRIFILRRKRMKTEDYLMNIGRQEKQFDALYRNAGAFFGLPDCAMWILYFLSSSEQELSQQDLTEKMMFPKQTINSAVTGLTKKGLIELSMIPGTRNRKKITLTAIGKEFAEKTVVRMYKAECRAVEQMGFERMTTYMELYHDFFTCLQHEFQKDGLIDGTKE